MLPASVSNGVDNGVDFAQYVKEYQFPPQHKELERSEDEVVKLSVTILLLSSSAFQSQFPDGFHVHATLPAEDVNFSILINGDFDLIAERTSLLETDRNGLLLDSIFQMLEEIFPEEVKNSEIFKQNSLSYIPATKKKLSTSFLAKRIKQWKQQPSEKTMVKELTDGKDIRKWDADACIIPIQDWIDVLSHKYMILDPLNPDHKAFLSSNVSLNLSFEDALGVWDSNSTNLSNQSNLSDKMLEWLVKTCGGIDFPRVSSRI